jgi:glycogen synthase
MLGWEFPPYLSGGLGTACYGLTKGLDQLGVQVCFVLPTPVPLDAMSHVKFRTPSHLGQRATPPTTPADTPADSSSLNEEDTFQHVEFHRVQAVLQAYGEPVSYEETVRELIRLRGQQQHDMTQQIADLEIDLPEGAYPPPVAPPQPVPTPGLYEGDLMAQVQRFAAMAVELAADQSFDVIHAHDWMTFPAGLAVAKATGKPLIVHIHSTEFDRSGDNVNQDIYDIERMGMTKADRVVCVSYLTSQIVRKRYDIPAPKLGVVYNAVDLPTPNDELLRPISQREKIVLFLGRVTMQKGPEYFLQAARKVVDHFDNVRFVMAGSGDMITKCVKLAADLKLGSHVTFTGFLRGNDIDRIFAMADLYVMPSVSEPFGIAPLEALSHNVPVIISKQSGVSEVLTHALKVDFWDTDEMANKILAVLKHPPLQRTLRQHGNIEVSQLTWLNSAKELLTIYDELAPDGTRPAT